MTSLICAKCMTEMVKTQDENRRLTQFERGTGQPIRRRFTIYTLNGPVACQDFICPTCNSRVLVTENGAKDVGPIEDPSVHKECEGSVSNS